MSENKRYMIGIDLGTTNSALAYVDSLDPDKKIQVLKIPQLVKKVLKNLIQVTKTLQITKKVFRNQKKIPKTLQTPKNLTQKKPQIPYQAPNKN